MRQEAAEAASSAHIGQAGGGALPPCGTYSWVPTGGGVRPLLLRPASVPLLSSNMAAVKAEPADFNDGSVLSSRTQIALYYYSSQDLHPLGVPPYKDTADGFENGGQILSKCRRSWFSSCFFSTMSMLILKNGQISSPLLIASVYIRNLLCQMGGIF